MKLELQRTEIVWMDCSGKDSEMEISEILKPVIQTTIGYIVHDEKDFVHIAGEMAEIGVTRNNACILKINIIKRQDFDL